jgi:rhodanese-related sulfurtransferase
MTEHHNTDFVLATVDEIQDIVTNKEFIIIDARNPLSVNDQQNFINDPLPNVTDGIRPKAINSAWDKTTNTIVQLPPSTISKDTYIITHCGGGGRGELAKNYLIEQGYTNVYNGGGPRTPESWNIYGKL